MEKKNLMDKKMILKNEKKKIQIQKEKNYKNFFFNLSKNTLENIFKNIKKEKINENKVKNVKEKNKENKKFLIYGELKNWLIYKTNKIITNSKNFDNDFEKLKKKNQKKEKKTKNQKNLKKIEKKNEIKKNNYFLQIMDLKKKRNDIYNFYSTFEKEVYSKTLIDAKNFFLENFQDILDLKDTNKKNPIIDITYFNKISFRFSHNLFEKISFFDKKIKAFIVFSNLDEELKIFDINKF